MMNGEDGRRGATDQRLAAGRALVLTVACALLAAACSPIGTVIGVGATAGIAASQDRGIGGAISDTEIRLAINHLWFQADERLYRKINLQVQEARVLLSGEVDDPDIRVEAVRLAWQAEGVREVINEISIGDSDLADQAQDAWIAAQLKSKLVFDSDVTSINYSIQVVDRTVFLLGVAQSGAELQRVVDHAKELSYVRRVVSYVQLKEQTAERE